MPKYQVNHDLHNAAADKTIRKGEVVSESQLADIGFDGKDGRRSLGDLVLARPGGFAASISVVKGTEDVDPNEVKRWAPAKSIDSPARPKGPFAPPDVTPPAPPA
jgi:hypothetical protein